MGTNYNPSSIQSGFQSNDEINSDRIVLRDSIARMLSREGDTPNQMEVELDLNSHRALNVAEGTLGTDGVNLNQVTTIATNIANAVLAGATGVQTTDFTNSNPLTFNFGVATGSQGLNNRTEFDLATLFGVGTFTGLTVFVNGVFQIPGQSYNLSTATEVTFTESLDPASDVVFIYGDISPTPLLGAANIMINETSATATGGQTVFTAPTYVIGGNQLLVFIDGVAQSLAFGDYTETSTTSITLDTAMAGGERVAIRSLSGS